jgi:hypothetical protein
MNEMQAIIVYSRQYVGESENVNAPIFSTNEKTFRETILKVIGLISELDLNHFEERFDDWDGKRRNRKSPSQQR